MTTYFSKFRIQATLLLLALLLSLSAFLAFPSSDSDALVTMQSAADAPVAVAFLGDSDSGSSGDPNDGG